MQILDNWLDDIPQQFQGKHNIEVLIGAIARQLEEIQEVVDQLNNETDLETAVGQQLDYVGTIIPLSRKEAGELAGINVEDPVISDERYRQFLRYKNLVNTNECTYYDLMEGLKLLWDVSPIYYIEDPDMPATIILTMPFLTPDGKTVRLGEVPMVKPAGVRIEFQYLIRVAVETIVNWIYRVYEVPRCNTKLCGQYPRRGSLGEILYVETNSEIEEIRKMFNLTKTGTIRVGGRLYNSTTGQIVTENVEVTINSQYEIEEVTLAGQILSGTHPTRAVNGVIISSGVEAGENNLISVYENRQSGTFPRQATLASLIGSSVETDRIISNSVADLPLSGTVVTGGKEEEQTLTIESEIVSTEPTVYIATATVIKCGTKRCGNKSKEV